MKQPPIEKRSRRQRDVRLSLSEWIASLSLSMATSLPDLSEDTVTEILSWLPVKSLLRFRTVSKSWLSIISDPQFIKSQSAANRKPSIVVSQRLYRTPSWYEYFFPPQVLSDHHYRIISTCNGIVCVASYEGGVIFLWNPSTKKYKKLPSPKKYNYDVYDRDTNIGFGYDSISNDYKVLYFEYQRDDDCVKLVQLFSTIADSWREIRVYIPLPRSLSRRIGYPVLINGVLYFEEEDKNMGMVLFEEEDKNMGIITFDLHNEVFGVVRLPSNMRHRRSQLLDFESSLAIIIINSIGDGLVYQDICPGMLKDSCQVLVDPWMLDDDNDYGSAEREIIVVPQEISLWTLEYGDEGRVYWIKKFTFENDFKIGWVNLYMGDGLFYGRNTFDNGYYSPGYDIVCHICYDCKKKVHKYFRLQDEEFPRTLKYTESLASIEGFEYAGAEAGLKPQYQTLNHYRILSWPSLNQSRRRK